MNPGGMTTGVMVGLTAALVITAGVGSAAGVSVARFTTAITDTTAIRSAAIATVASPRRSHLAGGLGGGSGHAALLATGSSVAGGGVDDSCVTSRGRGASLVERLSAVS